MEMLTVAAELGELVLTQMGVKTVVVVEGVLLLLMGIEMDLREAMAILFTPQEVEVV